LNRVEKWQGSRLQQTRVTRTKMASLVGKLLQKGNEIVVDGKLVTNTYETKEGEKRYGTSIELNEFLLLTKSTETAK
jgi:single-strand DNA-binding protein